MTHTPTENRDTELDTILGICATYGTPVLGTKDQEHYIEGFKHSRTYAEALAALQAYNRLTWHDGYKAGLENRLGWTAKDVDNHVAALKNGEGNE